MVGRVATSDSVMIDFVVLVTLPDLLFQVTPLGWHLL